MEVAVFENDTVNAKGLTVKRPLAPKKGLGKARNINLLLSLRINYLLKQGIDPYNKMIDRIPDDNLIAVEEEE